MGDLVLLSGSGATRHSCKVCRKGFTCGRSLGGHMRSHSLAEMETAAVGNHADDNNGDRRRSDCVMALGAGGYGLRENPKKTRRLSSVHGGRGGEPLSTCAPEMMDHERRQAPRGGVEVEEPDREQEDALLIAAAEPDAGLMPPAPRRRRRSMRVPAPALPAAFDSDAEDVARCLVTLSRDIIHRRDAKAAGRGRSPPKYRRRRQHDHNYADSDDDDAAYPMFQHTDADVGIKLNKRKIVNRNLAGDEKRSRYECPGCGRAFQSYQALGGHRASHKRINSNCSIVKVSPEEREPSIKTNASFSISSADTEFTADIADTAVAAFKAKTHRVIKFECPICFKVFGSGQALGGHKRSHSIAGELYERAHGDGDSGMDDTEPQPLIDDGFLDLNLPAPGAED
ncbi:hypothetical protein U9M48_007705 [Paspalum notatum var. saurae]|uniref:C2H2-type domain-containing protein n=1 Tax=Paspalum notatum var. saurae TaxID=547442 RepID=A0AAQ3SMX9_PASNO